MVTSKRRRRSEAEFVDYDTGNLLRALKRDMLKAEGSVDCQRLHKKGYGKRLLAKLEEA
jgi:hypothetical protein